jgi:hypothetical protein
MKHPVSVSELLELHRLGELYLKWAETPFALSEDNLQELQEISDRYSINHSSALFSFQKQHQHEFNLTVENSQPLVEAIEQAMKPEAMARLAEALRNVPETPMEQTACIVPVEVRERRELSPEERRFLEDQAKVDHLLNQAAATGEAKRELELLLEAKKIGGITPGAWKRIKFLEKQLEEVPEDGGLIEDDVEESPADREAQAQSRADQLREFRAQLDGEMSDVREIEILRDISNVDELTDEEAARLDELLAKAPIVPVGVVQDAISTGHINKVK